MTMIAPQVSVSFPPARDNINLTFAGRQLQFYHPASLEELWEAMQPEEFADERIPYWSEIWPASLALAQWLLAKTEGIRGKLCLDLGCGLGFTALAGSALGGKVAAVDLDVHALEYCRKNSVLNDISLFAQICADWRRPSFKKSIFAHIWGADIVYEKRFIEPLAEFLNYALAPDGSVWVADPNRNIFPLFKGALENKSWRVAPVFQYRVPAIRPPCAQIDVTIWELRKLG